MIKKKLPKKAKGKPVKSKQKKTAPRKTVRETRILKRQAQMKKRGKRKGVVRDEDVEALIEKSRQRGFVTYSEILYAFPEIEKDVDGLERLYQRLEEEGIQVEEVREYLDTEKSEEEKGRLLVESDAPLDPVQMYLKEIGKISFVTAEQERELAKRRGKIRLAERIQIFHIRYLVD